MLPNESALHSSESGCRAIDIGKAFREFGAAILSSAWTFEVSENEIIGRVALPEVQGVQPVVMPLAYLDRATLIQLIRELKKTRSQK